MSTDQASTFFALLAFMAIAVGIIAFALALTRKTEQLLKVADVVLPLAFVVALTSTLGSLYYSGIAHYTPCRFCWWQRIMMYPLAPMLGIAAFRRDRSVIWYALPLATVGFGIAAYHKWLQEFPDSGGMCDAVAPCTQVWVDTFGFASIPFMAGAGFFAIAGLLTVQLVLNRTPSPTP